MAFRGPGKPVLANPAHLPKLGRFWRIGRALLCQPLKGHIEKKFLGINYVSTYKKIS